MKSVIELMRGGLARAKTEEEKRDAELLIHLVCRLMEAARLQQAAIHSLQKQLSAADKKFIAARSPTTGALIAGHNALYDCGEVL